MRLWIFAIVAGLAIINSPAEARHRHAHHSVRQHRQDVTQTRSGLVTMAVAGHRVTVAASAVGRFRGFIIALERIGHVRDIQCYSPNGHMPGSKHHWGGACDFDQTSRNVTARVMYHVAALAHTHGLVDGCTWRSPDCGHVEVPGRTHATRPRHYAGFGGA